MRRKSGASGQQPTSGVAPSVFGNGRVVDSLTPNPPHSHSSTSSLDSMAMSEDEEELVISQLIPSSPELPRGHASFIPEAQLSLTRLQPSSRVQLRTSTLEIISADGADKRKPNSSCSVGVPSPPGRSTHILSRSRDLDPARVSSPNYLGNSEDIMNGEDSHPLATHIPTAVFQRPTRPTETSPDPTPDGFRCGMEVSEDLTAQDIGIFPGAVPEENSLWWCYPIFEPRAKTHIRRSLRALLPSDPSQDPSPVETDDWRAEVHQRLPGVQIWERSEDARSGPLDRGSGLWPKSKRPAAATEPDGADSLHPQNGADTEVVITNSHRSTRPPILELPSRNRSPLPEDVADEGLRPPNADGVVSVEAANGDMSVSEVAAQTTALAPLVKDKTVRFIDAPGEVDRVSERGSVAREVLNTSTRTRRIIKRRFRPDNAEPMNKKARHRRSRPDDADLMSKKDIPGWRRCTLCARRKQKCAPRVGSQPPYRCFRCQDHERECIPYKKDPRRPEHEPHPRLKIANSAAGTSLRHHSRPAGPSHPKDIVIPAPPPEDYPLGAVRRAKRHKELRLARHQVRKAELETDMAERNLKVARERKRLADEQYLTASARSQETYFKAYIRCGTSCNMG